ncbi:MAG: sigma-70 family RNA polymerase sigma factor [Oscillospiraceae bacterium]|jgi:RNA polymerase sigma-70 factor (ECF subfamily)|nr:sigma-70 family RNA polymerase sigma factor [Oscillospiraceae bacterium]
MDSVRAAGNVHSEAIERMMDAYGTAVLRMCYAFLKDYALAEDAAQDAFIKAYRGLDGFLGAHEMSEKAWLMRIAVNTCKDYRRSAWFRFVDRNQPIEEAAQVQCLPSPSDRALMDEVMALPMKLKEVVLLYYYQGLDYNEIMQSLGISRSAVYDRLEKAKKKLRGALERWDCDEEQSH